MLCWDFEEKVGSLLIKQTADQTFTINLYRGNALLIMLWEWEENGKEMYNMYNFFADLKHLTNVVKNDPQIFAEWQAIVIHRKYYKKRELHALIDAIGECNPDCTITLI